MHPKYVTGGNGFQYFEVYVLPNKTSAEGVIGCCWLLRRVNPLPAYAPDLRDNFWQKWSGQFGLWQRLWI